MTAVALVAVAMRCHKNSQPLGAAAHPPKQFPSHKYAASRVLHFAYIYSTRIYTRF
jgi:hypothetical protein